MCNTEILLIIVMLCFTIKTLNRRKAIGRARENGYIRASGTSNIKYS